MANPLLTMLVACDRRRNPAMGLFERAASDFGKALGSLCTSIGDLCESSSTPSYGSSDVRKPSMAASARGSSVDVSGASKRPAPVALKYTKMQFRTVPDYAGSVRAAVGELEKKYKAQQHVVMEIKSQIDSHERIDLEALGREIRGFQDEIDKCRSSEDDLLRQRRSYREEGLLRSVFVHGLAMHSLSRQIRRLREKQGLLKTNQSERKALIDERNSFDFKAQRELLGKQEEKLSAIGRKYLMLKDRLVGFDSAMGWCVARMSDTARRLNAEIGKYNSLSRYEAQLNAASNSYERYLVHQECEANFGDGRVRDLRSKVLSRIRSLSASYDRQVRQAAGRAREIGLL